MIITQALATSKIAQVVWVKHVAIYHLEVTCVANDSTNEELGMLLELTKASNHPSNYSSNFSLKNKWLWFH